MTCLMNIYPNIACCYNSTPVMTCDKSFDSTNNVNLLRSDNSGSINKKIGLKYNTIRSCYIILYVGLIILRYISFNNKRRLLSLLLLRLVRPFAFTVNINPITEHIFIHN